MSESLMITATGIDLDRLVAALNLNPYGHLGGCTTEGSNLVFHRFKTQGSPGAFPYYLSAEGCIPILTAWLSDDKREFGPQPDIDGSCKKGWKLEASGMMDEITISPHWLIFHK